LIKWATEETKESRIKNVFYQHGDIHDGRRWESYFDVIQVGDFIAGLQNPIPVLDTLSDALVPGGLLIVEEIDLSQWSIVPPDENWHAVISLIQSKGKRHAARELMPILDQLCFVDVKAEEMSQGRRLDTLGMFSTLHTFLNGYENILNYS